MQEQSNTDVMQLFVIMAASIFGSSVANIIGPYMLIMFAAATGAGWSLGRREPGRKRFAALYFVRIVLTAVLLTVGVTKVVAGFVPQVQPDGFIAAVAFIIGLIGDDWYKIGDWAVQTGLRIINKKIDKE